VGAQTLNPAAQVRLIKTLIEKSGKTYDKVTMQIVGDTGSASDLVSALSKINSLNLAGKEVPFSVMTNSKAGANCYYYLSGSTPAESDSIAFTDNKTLVEQGVLVGLTQEGTLPRVYMNLSTLKKLKIQYPTGLMKMVTLVE
jgi:hypothetical protein